MLGGEPRELDLVVEGELEPVLRRAGGRARQYDRFGTATVSWTASLRPGPDAARDLAHPGALPEREPGEPRSRTWPA